MEWMKSRKMMMMRTTCVYSSVEQTLDLVSQHSSGPKNSWMHTHTQGIDALPL